MYSRAIDGGSISISRIIAAIYNLLHTLRLAIHFELSCGSGARDFMEILSRKRRDFIINSFILIKYFIAYIVLLFPVGSQSSLLRSDRSNFLSITLLSYCVNYHPIFRRIHFSVSTFFLLCVDIFRYFCAVQSPVPGAQSFRDFSRIVPVCRGADHAAPYGPEKTTVTIYIVT